MKVGPMVVKIRIEREVEDHCCALAADRLEQIRKLQESANKRLEEYREVTALLRDALNRLEIEAYRGRPYPRDSACGGCPTCAILKRAEVMNLR